MIQDRINPKFPKLSEQSQVLWLLFETLQDYKTHQFFYSIQTLCGITGRYHQSIIRSISDLEFIEVISIIRKHRQVNKYTLLECPIKKNGYFVYPLSMSDIPSNVVKSYPRKCPNIPSKASKSVSKTNDTNELQETIQFLSPSDLSPSDLSITIPNNNTGPVLIAETMPIVRKDKSKEEKEKEFLLEKFQYLDSLSVERQQAVIKSREFDVSKYQKYLENKNNGDENGN